MHPSQATNAGSDLYRLIPLAVWSGLGLIAVVLVSRSAAGAFARPLPPIISGLIGTAALALSLIAWWWDDRLRGGWRHPVAGVSDPGPLAPHSVAAATDPGYSTARVAMSSWDRSVRGLMAILPALAIGLTTSGGASAAIGVLLGLGLISAAAVLAVTWELDPWLALRPVDDRTQHALHDEAPDRSHHAPRVEPRHAERDVYDDPAVSQHITRRTTPDGLDCLDALLRISFAAGERESVVHLPLHPPLPGPPEVECEPLDDADLNFKVTTAQPYGVRIEVRRGGEYGEACTFAVGVALHARRAAETAA